MIITSSVLRNIDEIKVIAVIKQISTNQVPTFLKTKLYIDFSKNDDYEYGFDELIRTIHNSPLYIKPEIGNNPFNEVNDNIVIKSHDGILEIMEIIVRKFENSIQNYILYKDIFQSTNTSRIMLDILIKQSVELGYIELDKEKDIILLEKGKIYAINNNLV